MRLGIAPPRYPLHALDRGESHPPNERQDRHGGAQCNERKRALHAASGSASGVGQLIQHREHGFVDRKPVFDAVSYQPL